MFDVLWPGHEPSSSCFDFSQRNARMTVSSPPFDPPYFASAWPRCPGLRKPIMFRIIIGLLMIATELTSAGLGERGTFWLNDIAVSGAKFSVGPSYSVSIGSNSRNSSGGGGSSSGSISSRIVGSIISTATALDSDLTWGFMLSKMPTMMKGIIIAKAGPASRCICSFANLYSQLSRGMLMPSRVLRIRSRRGMLSKRSIIS